MRHIFFCSTLLVFAALLIACAQQAASNDDSPTGAYKRLFAAVKSKNTEAIKAVCSKKTIELAGFAAARENKPVEEVFSNGFTGTTASDSLPEMRDERIKGTSGAVEVYNAKAKNWEDIPFVREDGAWKLGVGDAIGGTWSKPAPSMGDKERMAANAIGNNMKPLIINTNGIKPVVPKPGQNPGVRVPDNMNTTPGNLKLSGNVNLK